jgi:hypothetical protein
MQVRLHLWFLWIGVVVAALAAPAPLLEAWEMPSARRGLATTNDLVPPVIHGVSGDLDYDGILEVMTTDGARITKVVLVPAAIGALFQGGPQTVLPIIERDSEWVRVHEPESPEALPPGPYLLFIEKPGLVLPLVSAGWPLELKAVHPVAALPARVPSDRGPLGGLPWISMVVAAFALVAWRLTRISEPIEQGDR